MVGDRVLRKTTALWLTLMLVFAGCASALGVSYDQMERVCANNGRYTYCIPSDWYQITPEVQTAILSGESLDLLQQIANANDEEGVKSVISSIDFQTTEYVTSPDFSYGFYIYAQDSQPQWSYKGMETLFPELNQYIEAKYETENATYTYYPLEQLGDMTYHHAKIDCYGSAEEVYTTLDLYGNIYSFKFERLWDMDMVRTILASFELK